MFTIKDIRIEYQKNPIGIDNFKPRFSWTYEKSNTSLQKTYRILVASDKSLLQTNQADMWDSGVVISQDTINITYQGKPLNYRGMYFLKCMVTNEKEEISESEINTFEMTLNGSDWKGNWISLPLNFNGGTLYFRKQIKLAKDKKIKKARGYVCAIGYHEFYINGKKVGDNVLSPAITEYSKRVFYKVYDITTCFDGEDNVFGIEVGYGWYGSRKVLAQFFIEYEDGTVYEDYSNYNDGWWVAGSPVTENSIYGGETYDARLEDNYKGGWASKEFEPTWNNGWMFTILTQPPLGELTPELMEPIKVVNTYNKVIVNKISEKVFVYDIMQNISGWAKILVKGERSAKITLKYAEGLKENGEVNQLNLRSARCTDVYILKGEGIEEYAPRFTYHGFQYVQIEIEGQAEIIGLVGEHVHTDVEKIGDFSCSNEKLNLLHKIAVVTEENNLMGIMTDCPQRDERFGWLNDLSSRIYQTVYNFKMDRFFAKFVKDITHTQNEDGAIADTAPYYTGGRPSDVVCVSYLLFGLEGYKQYGDIKLVEDEYKNFKLWVEYLLTRQKDFIMDYYYYADWVTPEKYKEVKTDGIYLSSVFLYWHLISMSRLAEIIDNNEDKEKYSNLAIKSKQAINEKYYNSETKNYSSGTQTENSIAVSLGIAPIEECRAIIENINKDMVKRNYHCTSGNQGYRHVFYTLSDYGYIDTLIKMITNPEYPGWGYMIENGATTVWERWEKEMQNVMHSFDHPMFGSYDAWLYKYLGGISIEEDAFACDKITIKPCFASEIDFVNCSLNTVRGKIVCNWNKSEDYIFIHVEIPYNTQAKVVINGVEKALTTGEYDFEFKIKQEYEKDVLAI